MKPLPAVWHAVSRDPQLAQRIAISRQVKAVTADHRKGWCSLTPWPQSSALDEAKAFSSVLTCRAGQALPGPVSNVDLPVKKTRLGIKRPL